MISKSKFKISKMDCPSEESLIRAKLEDFDFIAGLEFKLDVRELTVYHHGRKELLESALNGLNLDSELIETSEISDYTRATQDNQRKLLWTVLWINFAFFLIEIFTGFISDSMGLVADSLDMLADSFVYGLSLLAVGGTIGLKKRVASGAGYMQLLLAVLGFSEVVRRFISDEIVPEYTIMIAVSIFALIGNGICLLLLNQSEEKDEAHMKASLIFTSNDVIINLGVISAGLLVLLFNSSFPDLIVGSIIFIIVSRGAYRILQLGK